MDKKRLQQRCHTPSHVMSADCIVKIPVQVGYRPTFAHAIVLCKQTTIVSSIVFGLIMFCLYIILINQSINQSTKFI